MNPRIITVVITDDSAFMRRAIQKMLEKEPDIRVVGTAASGEEGIAMIERLRPDVVTMDVEMPGMGGLEAARTLVSRRTRSASVKVSSLLISSPSPGEGARGVYSSRDKTVTTERPTE